MGLSDHKPGRNILDWPNDVIELADYLKVGKFAVVGTSGGAAYVASCALKIPARLTRVAIVGGLGPFDVPEVKENLPLHLRRLSFASRKTPWIMRFFLERWRNLALRNPERFLARSFALFSSTETSVLTRADGGQNYLAGFVEAHRAGTHGSTYDMGLLARPWGFSLEDITPTIYLWHGEADRAAPVTMGRYLASQIPNCRAKFLPGEGHTTLFLNHADEIFGVLTSS
jgi:pimeloyl-ACP methyl ester carboxylesterase